ncbi:MAG: MATE family efflux transporter [Methanomicrobiaceae archaeon]|nr:MATE family efflux transporter [Methanomicrobiaceae archaeon]
MTDSPPRTGRPHPGTEGTRTLLSDPRTAIIKLSLPMMVAMTLLTLYNLVDAFWVAGLGADALAAIGFTFPLFFIVIGLANGLGIGGGAAISRMIGARNKAGADCVAVHTMLMMVLLAAVVTVPIYIFAGNLFILLGAGDAAGPATDYARVLFLGSGFILFTNVAYGILRSEGDAKRPMYAMAAGAIGNIILDPILIYGLDMGIAGAAWATVLSILGSMLILAFWLFVKRDTYVSFSIRGFSPKRSVIRAILRVGLPASMEQMTMAATTLLLNGIIVMVASTDGVAIYSVGWRVVMIAITPLIAIATAVVAVTGANFGSRSYAGMESAHLYAVRLGLGIGAGIAVMTFIFAPQIAAIFTISDGAARLAPDLTAFLRVMCLFYPAVGFGMFSSSLFQGTGKGLNSLLVNVLRTVVLTVAFVWVLAVSLGFGLEGVWWGIAAGNIIGGLTGFAWARRYTAALLAENGGA